MRVLAPDGALVEGAAPSMETSEIEEAMRLMVLSRAVDERAVGLQRQGRLGAYSPVIGQEASVTGSAMALDPARDWVVPQYRELPAYLHQGLPLERLFLQWTGHVEGGHIPDSVRMLPIQISIAAQIPQAAGLAWGLRLQGLDAVVVVYFGEGASSEGDFHEGMGIAGVTRAPVIFFLQNNQYAISTPRHSQSAAPSLAARGPGYGMPGHVVDGNDLLAVNAVTQAAVARARAGEGPTLIESQTYRMGPHNTSDNPARYEDPELRARWAALDPIDRVERYLVRVAGWDQSRRSELEGWAREEVERAHRVAMELGGNRPEYLFEHVYADPPERLLRERGRRLGGD
ncbi:MAG TPA: thiamine pyrophosphate-dependent enzyme [Candidatus Dormibacteraeota bacterium]|nr:thiamine pyrophosphate-dependent enzyme [Candidatus Dormibacteraeota bacterium]